LPFVFYFIYIPAITIVSKSVGTHLVVSFLFFRHLGDSRRVFYGHLLLVVSFDWCFEIYLGIRWTNPIIAGSKQIFDQGLSYVVNLSPYFLCGSCSYS